MVELEVKDSQTNLQYAYFKDSTLMLKFLTFFIRFMVTSRTKVHILDMEGHEVYQQEHIHHFL